MAAHVAEPEDALGAGGVWDWSRARRGAASHGLGVSSLRAEVVGSTSPRIGGPFHLARE